MKKFLRNLGLAGCIMSITWILTGCSGSSTPGSTAPSATAISSGTNASGYPELPTAAQPRLQTIKLWMGLQEMITELAITPMQQETGMMFRTNMAPNEGMLFPYAGPTQVSFWMMNTVLPLSAAYISPDGIIQEIHDFKPFDTNSVVSASNNIQFVLEASKDYFASNHIGVGALVKTEYGPLRSIFTPGR